MSAPVDLKPYALLSDLTDDDREALGELLEFRRVAAKRRLFREGSEADGLILLASGRVELSTRRGAAPHELGPGSSFGGLSLMLVGPREVTARTLEPCEIWELPREQFRRLVDDHPHTACRLCEAVVAEFAGAVRESLQRLAAAPAGG